MVTSIEERTRSLPRSNIPRKVWPEQGYRLCILLDASENAAAGKIGELEGVRIRVPATPADVI